MPRQKRYRRMHMPPSMMGFKPFGIPARDIESVTLLLEEFESIKLADYDNLNQEEAAKKMNISRPTFTRIYECARKKIAKSFVEGKAILIEGGFVEFNKEWFKCTNCHETFILKNSTQRRCPSCKSEEIEPVYEKMSPDDKKDNYCVCFACNIKIPHQHGIPCKKINCPSCGKPLLRE